MKVKESKFHKIRHSGESRNPGFPVKTGIQIHIFLSA